MPIAIPPAFAENTALREGDAAREWLAALPDLVQQLLGRWCCELAGDPRHGAVGIVVPVTWRDTPAVLKVSFPHPGNTGEWGALAAFDGHGAVRLYEVDPDRFAMLIEGVHQEDLTSIGQVDEALVIAGEVAQLLAVPAAPGSPRLSHAARGWESDLAERHHREANGEPLPDGIVDAAINTIRELAMDDTDTLIHGDLHFSNVLRADREPWLVIDPKGYAGPACFDAGTVVREGLLELVSDDDLSRSLASRVSVFSAAASTDVEMAMRCAQARFVSSYYWELQHQSPRAVVDAMRVASIAASRVLT